MLIKTNFRSDSNNKEILPMDQTGFPYVCMHTELGEYMDQSFPWHWHSAFEIDYIAEGELEFRTADAVVHVRKGETIFINSGIMHTYRATANKECRIYAHLFDMHFLTGMHHSALDQKYLFPILKNDALQFFRISPDMEQNIRMTEKILNLTKLAKEEAFGYEFEIRAELCRFWCLLLEGTKEIRSEKGHRNITDMERIKVMLQFIHEHYMEKITLESIACRANISGRECARCFQRCISRSPIHYLNDYRIRMAAQMLLQTGDRVLTISENCGFSSNSYFGKVFHEVMGCSPAEYRKHNQ